MIGRRTWLVGLATMLTACGGTGPSDARERALDDAQARWEALGPSSYVYAVMRQCFCPIEFLGPARLTVEDGVVVSRIYVGSGDPVPPGYDFPAVDGLFDVIRSALADDADEILATYDPDLGIPLEIWIDFERMAADEEIGWTVTEEVTALP